MADTITVTIKKIINETKDVRTFRLSPEDDKAFSFLPGQFVMLSIDSDAEKQKRAYSISSSPTQAGYFEITFRIEGKFTSKLDQMKEGEKLIAAGPFGHFTFKDEIKQDLVIIAGGTGIAPFRSYINYILEKKFPNKITLFYSSKTPEEVIYYKEFKELQQKNPQLKILFTVTRHNGDGWPELTGRFNEKIFKTHIDSFENKIYYSCGSTAFVNEMVAILKNNGVKDEQIKSEKWG